MKRFYNNTIMSGALSKVLRVFALLCVLFGVSATAWGAEYLVGSFNNWTANDETKLDYNLNKNTYQVILQESNTLYEFKVKQDDNKFFGAGENNQMTTDANWKLDKTTNVYLKATKTGPYTFFLEKWEESNNNWYPVIQVWYPAQEIYVTGSAASGWGTWDKCTGNEDIISVELKNGQGDLKFSNTSDYNNNWYNAQYKRGESIGATLSGNRGDNITVTLQQGYGSPVYFKYNKATGYIWVEATKGGGGDESDHTYALAGTFNNWSTAANSCEMKSSESCVQELELTKGTYTFKLVKDGVWYGKSSNTTLGPINSEGVNYTTNTAGNGDDITLSALNDGIYKFTITDNNDGTLKVHIAYFEKENPVLISHLPLYSNNMKQVTLYGYLQESLCPVNAHDPGTITDYGFVICPGTTTSLCTPNKQSQRLKVSLGAIQRGDEFNYQVDYDKDRIIANAIYGYRAYVVINDEMYLSAEVGTFMLLGDCTPPRIDLDNPELSPIIYTIDASLGQDFADDCNLVYGSLQTALNRLKEIANDNTITDATLKYTTNNTFDDHNSIDLNAPIVFNIHYYDDTPDESSKAYCYEGDTQAGVSGGGASSESAYSLIIKDINRNKADSESYTLTLQNAGEGARPWLHHVILRNSRNVVLDNLALFSDPTETNLDDALEFDINSSQWNNLGGVGAFKNAQIVVKNCMIGSNGFTGVHASAYDGITFINNEFEAIMAKTDNQNDLKNAITYGASAKFLACSNIQFVRNNFRGAHATLLWIQECRDALFMNNVFWNTNQYAANCSAVRMVDQFANTVTNVGFYYNTFYLEDDGVESSHKYDFLHYSSINDGNTPAFSNIEFMYNNCYSYDTDLAGKDQDPVTKNVSGANYCPNNFWSKNANANFAFGQCDAEDTHNINVAQAVCSTTATGPSSLQIKEPILNKGICPQTDLAEALGVESTYRADRYNDVIRPETVTAENIANNEGWTFGAYQSQSGVELKKIYWVGLSTDWDDRNNWVYYPSEQTAEGRNSGRIAETPQRVSCINSLSADLQVVIPENSLLGMDYVWPVVPTNFNENRSNLQYNEEVSAGKGTGIDPTQYASTIEIEYGAAIKGVENLGEAVHYNKATSHFVAKRSQWILVGTVVKPFVNGNSGEVRNVKSGNYFLNYEPNVYMHEAIVNDMGQATWNKAFADLEIEVSPDQVFAINIPDEYGNGRISSRYYYNKILFLSRNGDVNDGTQAKPFSFTGRFANDAAMPSFDIVDGKARMMNNSYPCNVSAKAVEESEQGTVSYYDYEAGSFRPLGNDDVMLKPQHGFVFTAKETGTFIIDQDMLANGNTRSRSAEQPKPSFAIGLYNAGNNTNMSEIIVRYDAEHTNGVEHIMDSKKVYSPIAETPELYMLMYDAEYARLHTAKAEQTIPLGIMLKQDMSVKFAVLNNNQYSKVMLLDKQTGKEYNLLHSSYTTEPLATGTLEGRFYLNLSVEGEYDSDQDINIGDFTTSVEDSIEDAASINILVDNMASSSIRVIGNNVELQTIYVSDMSGRTMRYDVSGSAVNLQLPVAGGVYLVQVIGDNATRTEKVVIK